MGCGASAEKVRSPHVTPQPDHELLQLLDEHGLAEQLPELQALGVTRTTHLSDLLVEDLEEAGLSRVQIRQLQRAVSQQSSTQASSIEPSNLAVGTLPALKELEQPHERGPDTDQCKDLGKECDPSWPAGSEREEEPASQLSQLKDAEESGLSPKQDDLPASPSQDNRCTHDAANGAADAKAKGGPGGPRKPPPYKKPSRPSQPQLVAARVANANSDHSNHSSSNSISNHPSHSEVLRDDRVEDRERDSRRSSESSLDFDVTLLPEVVQKPHPLNEQRQTRDFGAGPQPNVGDAPAPSSQLPAAVRRRLEAREEERKAQRSEDEAPPRVRSPRREPRSLSEKPNMRSANLGPRAASLGAVGRQMLSKNELRAAHRHLFMEALEKYEASREADAPCEEHTLLVRPVQVYVRKRPLDLPKKASEDFDVVSVLPGWPPKQLVLHNCLFQADLRTPVIHHMRFSFDHVIGDDVADEGVYQATSRSLVDSAKAGCANTVLMFGQTGSGKTHTMKAIERLAAEDLQGCRICVTFVELRGARCFDLLLPQQPELRLRETEKDSNPRRKLTSSSSSSSVCFLPEGAQELRPETPQELVSIFQVARQRRATSITAANDESSRSHAICSLRFEGSSGSLTLVDCAGTERRKDSAHHSRERQQEGAEINSSLHALKECIRFMSKKQRIPPHAFRASALTKMLAASLSSPEARLSVICTIAPAAADTEHTMSTLRIGAALLKAPDSVEKEVLQNSVKRDPHPRQWSPSEVQTWLRQLEDGLFSDVCSSLPAEFTGQMLL